MIFRQGLPAPKPIRGFLAATRRGVRVRGDLSARPPIIAATSRTRVVGSGTTVIPLASMDPRAVDREGIAEANRGTIDVSSKEGVGTTFTIRLSITTARNP